MTIPIPTPIPTEARPVTRRLRGPTRAGRATPRRQGSLPFLRRAERLDRAFKATILVATTLAVGGAVAATPAGRHATIALATRFRWAASRLMGMGVDRAEVEEDRHRARLRGVDVTRAALGLVERDRGPALREFLRVAGMGRDSAVIRWGNFDWTLVLSSAVFEPDDAGRSYRLRPGVRSTWLINLTFQNVAAMFEIPDTPEARRLGQAAGGTLVPGSEQSTNSWGCRGAEPDPAASVRGIVLGDSNMQGLLVGDDQCPPARLEARLTRDLGVPVSVLNTGTLGYSIEQYYHSLLAYYDRLRPQFVIISVCNNDVGDPRNDENWAEGEYWLDQITQFCRTRGLDFLLVPVPAEDDLLGRRNESVFPGRLTAIYKHSGLAYANLTEAFTDEHTRLRNRARLEGAPFSSSPLFNRKYGDNHMSPAGCDLWAALVARRLGLIWGGTNPGGVGPLKKTITTPTTPVGGDPPAS